MKHYSAVKSIEPIRATWRNRKCRMLNENCQTQKAIYDCNIWQYGRGQTTGRTEQQLPRAKGSVYRGAAWGSLLGVMEVLFLIKCCGGCGTMQLSRNSQNCTPKNEFHCMEIKKQTNKKPKLFQETLNNKLWRGGEARNTLRHTRELIHKAPPDE